MNLTAVVFDIILYVYDSLSKQPRISPFISPFSSKKENKIKSTRHRNISNGINAGTPETEDGLGFVVDLTNTKNTL